MKKAKDIIYVGVDDTTLDLFEGQYVVPEGMSYNSYVIMDEKVAVMDAVDKAKIAEWLGNVEDALAGRQPDYLVISHMEPDHSAGVAAFAAKYPEVTVVGNAKIFDMFRNFYGAELPVKLLVKEGDKLSLGEHELTFYSAPMVHWPEVMLTYDQTDRALFSADAFGKFGALDADEPWEDEARRYYFNIVGKFGPSVQAVLKKAEGLDIRFICPLHGPVLSDTIPAVLGLYDLWSRYQADREGVLIACASLHGHTAKAARELAAMLESAGAPVQMMDLARCDASLALAEAFRYGRVVLAASSYNGGLMPFMEDFLHHLLAKNYQKRVVGLMENGSWAPSAAKCMRALLGQMKDIHVVEPCVTLRGTLKASDMPALEALAGSMMA